MKEPLVSVIMPAYNGEKYIGEAIESIRRQTWNDWELIIVEDCSTDRTASIIQQYMDDSRVKVFRNEDNRGIAYSRNRAIRESKGKYIAIQDDDDISLPDRLEREASFLGTHPDMDAVAAHWLMVDEHNENVLDLLRAYKNPKYVRAHLMLQDCIGNGSAMFRREFAIRNDIHYRDHMLGMEDYRFWIDFSAVGNISAVDFIAYKNRRYENRETQNRMRNSWEERRNLFTELQCSAMNKYGIYLNPYQKEIMRQMAGEKTDPTIIARDYMKLYEVFQSIIRQAKNLKLDFTEEISIACRKFLGRKIANSKGLWQGE